MTFNYVKGEESILVFKELIKTFNISCNTLYLHFKQHAALKAHKVPWSTNLQTHPVVNWILDVPSKGTVSYLYFCLTEHNTDVFPKANV